MKPSYLTIRKVLNTGTTNLIVKVRLFESCDWCNKQANDGDRNRNHVNYGSASAIARIMTDFGHNVHIPVWDDNGFLRIPKIVIDGEVFIDFEKSE